MSHYNRRHVRQHFSQAAQRYDEAAVLQKNLAEQIAERLALVKLDVNRVVDVGAGTGFLTEKLLGLYPQAQLMALDLSEQMLAMNAQRLARPLRAWLPKKLAETFGWMNCAADLIQADAYALPLADGSVDVIVSNLMLQWCDDLDVVFAEMRRILRPGGVLMFTSLGPDTLKELRQAWVEVEGEAGHQRMNQFIDMHDLGDALIRSGFGQPVMDVEHYTLTYEKPLGVLQDLKAIGATNAQQRRGRGLTGKARFAAMLNVYETLRREGRIPATYEVVHGHAWANEEVFKGPNRSKSGVHEITLEQFQSNLKSRSV
jgi:malonyl-CoA O-methyltransferase